MKKPPPRRRWLKWTLAAAILLLALPVAEVGWVRWFNPPFTPEMVRFRLGPKSDAARARGLRYEWMPLADVPRPMIRYLWASEDQRFFLHGGIDFEEIEQAMKESRKSGRPPRGGSTITQQCARSVFLWQGRSWLRKSLEACYAVLMEHLLSKRRILELYVNVIEFGEGIYGVKAAAETFYRVPPARLTNLQMAMLAAVLPNPKEWSPVHPGARALQRQRRVLRLERKADFPARELR
ncbi:MAG: monofunctional biosynthetic peptidoglycan transglycosylase [Terrimicrobiaceae bacterium]|nr:monofunctional biosynthetic peptidoglycan transglycosylase [Terrimicrobiaceae bacterium]